LQPAYICGLLSQGDEIIQIDGIPTKNKEEIITLLKGSDLPGSSVVVTVQKVRPVFDVNYQKTLPKHSRPEALPGI